MNRAKSRQQIQKEIAEMEQRPQESRQYIGQPKEQLEVGISEENDLWQTDFCPAGVAVFNT